MKKIFLIFAAVIFTVDCSTCPCDEGTNNNLKALELQICFLNRAICKSNQNIYCAFLEFLNNQKNRFMDRIRQNPTGLPGSVVASPNFIKFISAQIQCIQTSQNYICGGGSKLIGIGNYLECSRRSIVEAIRDGEEVPLEGQVQLQSEIDLLCSITRINLQ